MFKKSAGSTAKYQHHCLPTGYFPVEKNANLRCIIDGWEFFHRGWTEDTSSSTKEVVNDKGGDFLMQWLIQLQLKIKKEMEEMM